MLNNIAFPPRAADKPFTVEDGLDVQRTQLFALRPKLNETCYLDLAWWLKEQNSKLEEGATGFDVERGQALIEFVQNWAPHHLSPGAMANALAVITTDPKIAGWLSENDPKALEQCQRALGVVA